MSDATEAIGAISETHHVTPSHHHRRHDDSPPDGIPVDGPITPRDSHDALVDRETQSQTLRELLDARHMVLKAHDETHRKIDACISDVRALNSRADDIQGRLQEQTGALRNLTDAVVELVEGVKMQTAAVIKLERRVAKNEEDADDTKAAIATALGGEVKAREKLESYGEFTEAHLRAELAKQAADIKDTRSFLDKHFSTKRARWTAAALSGAGVVKVVYEIWEKLH